MFDRLKLHDAIAAAVPAATGVRIGRANDKATWVVLFPDGYQPSQAEADAAATAIAAFDPAAAGNVDNEVNAAVRMLAQDPVFRALVKFLAQKFAMTPAQVVAALKALV